MTAAAAILLAVIFSASDYQWVAPSSLSGITIDGKIMPRRGTSAKKVLRGEDVAFLTEVAEEFNAAPNDANISQVNFTPRLYKSQINHVIYRFNSMVGDPEKWYDGTRISNCITKVTYNTGSSFADVFPYAVANLEYVTGCDVLDMATVQTMFGNIGKFNSFQSSHFRYFTTNDVTTTVQGGAGRNYNGEVYGHYYQANNISLYRYESRLKNQLFDSVMNRYSESCEFALFKLCLYWDELVDGDSSSGESYYTVVAPVSSYRIDYSMLKDAIDEIIEAEGIKVWDSLEGHESVFNEIYVSCPSIRLLFSRRSRTNTVVPY